jgi:hypothetical protein
MPKITPTRVKKQVGLNPIAQLMARENMRKAIVDQKIQIYMRGEGEECVDFCIPIWMTFTALVAAAKVDPKVGVNTYEVKIIRGAISALEQMITDNIYRRVNIVSLETALDCAYTLVNKVNSALFNQEWNRLAGGM